MPYLTRYRIINNNDGSLAFKNANTSCFQEFNNFAKLQDTNMGYLGDRSIEVFFEKDVNKLPEELIIKWLNFIKSLGLKTKLSEFNYTKKNIDYPVTLNVKKIYRVVTLKFSDYDSKIKLKFALHLVRYLYENNLHDIIIEIYKNKGKFESIFELFQLRSIPMYIDGHKLVPSRYLIEIFTKKELFHNFELWSKIEYDNLKFNNSISNLFNGKIFKENNHGYKSANAHKIDLKTTLAEYKEITKQYVKK